MFHIFSKAIFSSIPTFFSAYRGSYYTQFQFYMEYYVYFFLPYFSLNMNLYMFEWKFFLLLMEFLINSFQMYVQ